MVILHKLVVGGSHGVHENKLNKYYIQHDDPF